MPHCQKHGVLMDGEGRCPVCVRVTRSQIEAREAGREIARKVNENFKAALLRSRKS